MQNPDWNPQAVPPERQIVFPRGLVGLPELKRWILVDMDPPLPMKWLQSLDREGFRLPVTDPGYYLDEYEFAVDAESRELLATDDADDLLVMIVSTISEGGTRITGNLSAPLVVNHRNRRGVQVILADESYPLRQEIDQARFGAAVAECLAAARTTDAAPAGAQEAGETAEPVPAT